MSTRSKVVAAIPNFNMGRQLIDLLPQLIKHNFDAIFVLDDNSNDNSVNIVKEKFPEVVLIEGSNNVGSAGNRNRIIKTLNDRNYDEHTTIVFIDADTQLHDKTNIPITVTSLFEKYPNCGVIGGKVLNADSSWGMFNYGPLPLLRWLRTAYYQLKIENLIKTNSNKAKKLHDKHEKLLTDWPNPGEKPIVKHVGWLVETFIFIKLGVFEMVGGFDSSLRYCESLDLGYKLNNMNLDRIFDPTLTITHLQIDNRGWHRNIEVFMAIIRLSAKRLIFR